MDVLDSRKDSKCCESGYESGDWLLNDNKAVGFEAILFPDTYYSLIYCSVFNPPNVFYQWTTILKTM